VSIVHLLWRALLKILIQLLRHNMNLGNTLILEEMARFLRVINWASQFRSAAYALPKKTAGRPRVRNLENVERM
jgi:hypothetical protein